MIPNEPLNGLLCRGRKELEARIQRNVENLDEETLKWIRNMTREEAMALSKAFDYDLMLPVWEIVNEFWVKLEQ